MKGSDVWPQYLCVYYFKIIFIYLCAEQTNEIERRGINTTLLDILDDPKVERRWHRQCEKTKYVKYVT